MCSTLDAFCWSQVRQASACTDGCHRVGRGSSEDRGHEPGQAGAWNYAAAQGARCTLGNLCVFLNLLWPWYSPKTIAYQMMHTNKAPTSYPAGSALDALSVQTAAVGPSQSGCVTRAVCLVCVWQWHVHRQAPGPIEAIHMPVSNSSRFYKHQT